MWFNVYGRTLPVTLSLRVVWGIPYFSLASLIVILSFLTALYAWMTLWKSYCPYFPPEAVRLWPGDVLRFTLKDFPLPLGGDGDSVSSTSIAISSSLASDDVTSTLLFLIRELYLKVQKVNKWFKKKKEA